MSGAGIDITPSHAVAIQVEQQGGQYRVKRAAILPGFDHHPEKAAKDASESGFAGAVKDLPGSMRRESLISLPGKEVIFRVTDVGAENPGAIRTLVNFEVEELTGSSDAMEAGWQLLDTPSGRKLLIGIARTEVIEHHAASLRFAGLPSTAFIPSGIGLYHAHLVSGDFSLSGVQMLVNIGDTSTDILFVDGGDLIALRSVQVGVYEFSSRVANALGVPVEQARETLFQSLTLKPGTTENVSNSRGVGAAQEAADVLIGQLRSSMAYARGVSGSFGLDPVRISICGQGGAIRGLPEYLRHKMHKPIALFDPLSSFDVSALDESSLSTIRPYFSSLAVPLGLAKLASDGASRQAVRLTPPSALARANFMKRTLWLYAGVALMALLLFTAMTLASKAREDSEEARQAAANAKAAWDNHARKLRRGRARKRGGVHAQFDVLPEIERQKLESEQKLIEALRIRVPALDAQNILSALAKALPPEAMLLSASFGEAGNESSDASEAVLKLRFFIRSSDRQVKAVFDEVHESLKSMDLVRKTDPEFNLSRSSDGSGAESTITVFLHDPSSLVSPSGAKGAE